MIEKAHVKFSCGCNELKWSELLFSSFSLQNTVEGETKSMHKYCFLFEQECHNFVYLDCYWEETLHWNLHELEICTKNPSEITNTTANLTILIMLSVRPCDVLHYSALIDSLLSYWYILTPLSPPGITDLMVVVL